jgi:bifunctional non-homologous end joining protein LigD
MLASLADARLDDPQLVYEPKYDGIRAIAEVGRAGGVRLWSRLGNEKTHQFPEIALALRTWSARLETNLVLDGEIVALDAGGEPTGFQQLQGRIHLQDSLVRSSRVAFIAFDLLREGRQDLREKPLVERRVALERLFASTTSPIVRISEISRGDGRALYRRALESGWEGLIAKDAGSRYSAGRRTPDWRKLKIVHEQEFIVCGWTEPRRTRPYFGALLLGVYSGPDGSVPRNRSVHDAPAVRGVAAAARPGSARELIYVGHTGTGFSEHELARVMKLLEPLETKESPFATRPRTNERPHWVKPLLVAQIKFTEWTSDGRLRHPVYLGLRDDKRPEQVEREEIMRVRETRRQDTGPRTRNPDPAPGTRNAQPRADDVIEQLRAIEASRRDGVVELPNGDRLAVTNLHKTFWPRQKLTKGDLFRYYADIAPFVLAAVADRPLVMKRFPNGVKGKPFYQHRAPDPPPGVRVESVEVAERRPQFVGGSLTTLLYMTQLAAISQDPWFSRVDRPAFADYAAFDLDPMPGVTFTRVLDVARWIHDELDTLGAVGVPKTSGADGLHVYVRLPPRTPYEAGLIFCQIVATVVVQKHPKVATVERSVSARGKRVYVDYLQNILGKTLATAYSARASDYAGVSTPLTWHEVEDGVKREDFTIETAPARARKVGDLWETVRKSKPVDLSRVARYRSHARS